MARRRPRSVSLLAVAALCLASCTSLQPASPARPDAATHAEPVRTTFLRTPDLVYSPPGWPEVLRGDWYQPQGPADTASAPGWPVVVLVHGGGWEGPDRRGQMASIAERLAQRGHAVFNVTYRFAPQYRYPAPLDDLREAVRWVRREAPSRGADPRRVAVFGYSAGGHLAAQLGVLPGSPETAVQAVVAGGAPTDLRKYPGGKLVPQFLGGTQDQVPDRFRAASPITHVAPGQPPVFLYHGDWDTLVPYDHATDYLAALQRAGVPAELFTLKWRGHITAFLTDGAAVEAAIGFLDRQFRPAARR